MKRYKAVKDGPAWKAGQVFEESGVESIVRNEPGAKVHIVRGLFSGYFEEIKEPVAKYAPRVGDFGLDVLRARTPDISRYLYAKDYNMLFDTPDLAMDAQLILREVAKYLPHTTEDKPRRIRLVVECDKEEATACDGYYQDSKNYVFVANHDLKDFRVYVKQDDIPSYAHPVKVIDLTPKDKV